MALGILGEPDPLCGVCEERLLCAAWNCLYELGLRPHRIDPALECESRGGDGMRGMTGECRLTITQGEKVGDRPLAALYRPGAREPVAQSDPGVDGSLEDCLKRIAWTLCDHLDERGELP